MFKAVWPYFEKAGTATGVLMTVLYILKVKECGLLREKFDKFMEQQVVEAKLTIASNVVVIEKNTTAINSNTETMKDQSDLIRDLINARRG